MKIENENGEAQRVYECNDNIAAKEKRIIVFDDKKIRRTYHNDEWHFSVVGVLSGSLDVRQYIKKMRQRDLELIFNYPHGFTISIEFGWGMPMLGEKVANEITKERDSEGFDECFDSAKEGGEVSGNAREDAEKRMGKSVVSKENYLEEKKKLIGEEYN